MPIVVMGMVTTIVIFDENVYKVVFGTISR